jgi:transposase
VDDKEQIIVAAAITQHEADNFEFQPMMEQVDKNLGCLPKQGSADPGNFTYDNLEYAALNSIDLYLPDPLLKALDSDEVGKFQYDKSRFLYNASGDVYLCPEGKLLRRYREQKRKDQPPLVVYRGESCGDCAVKGKCTKRSVREIFRDSREPLLEEMRAKLRTEEGKRTYRKRMYTVEPVFGDIKWNRAKLMLSLRGKLKVNGEFCLMCLVHNVKKIIKKVLKGGVDLLHNRLVQIDTDSVIEKSLLQTTAPV